MINKWKLWLKAAACRSHSAGLLLRSAHLLAAFCRKLGWGNTFDAAALFSSSDTKGGMFGTQRAAKWIIVSLSQGVCLSSDTWEQHEGGSERLSAAGWLMEGKGQDPCKTSSLREELHVRFVFVWGWSEPDWSWTCEDDWLTADVYHFMLQKTYSRRLNLLYLFSFASLLWFRRTSCFSPAHLKSQSYICVCLQQSKCVSK